MSRIHLFMNNPTAGSTDGTEISGGDETLPLTFTLDASQSESAVAKCAVRCDSGYSLKGGADIFTIGSSTSKWKLAVDDNYTDTDNVLTAANWLDSINVATVSDTNAIFWVRAEASADEQISNDNSVDIKAVGQPVLKGA